MTIKNGIYKCSVCGNIVEVLHIGAGELVCCGIPMNQQNENTVDAATEKHIPVINKKEGEIEITIGSILHPMEETHFIEWIELTVDGKTYKQYLNPNDVPTARFRVEGENINARAYCNLHGLWKS